MGGLQLAEEAGARDLTWYSTIWLLLLGASAFFIGAALALRNLEVTKP